MRPAAVSYVLAEAMDRLARDQKDTAGLFKRMAEVVLSRQGPHEATDEIGSDDRPEAKAMHGPRYQGLAARASDIRASARDTCPGRDYFGRSLRRSAIAIRSE
ncbi:hypothetical protein X743_30365 [Mesorhizobium sp. LNHC252B00]|nr:hypothetical protein X743_30365 [Mesorhizobium sp. LNHC252B00]